MAALSGLAVWWCGRRYFTLSGMMIYALILVLPRRFSDFAEMMWGDDRKEVRRDKVERAIARREAMLAQMDGRTMSILHVVLRP